MGVDLAAVRTLDPQARRMIGAVEEFTDLRMCITQPWRRR
jgi:hypothetical protein